MENLGQVRLGVSKTPQIHLPSPNIGFPYFNFFQARPSENKHPVNWMNAYMIPFGITLAKSFQNLISNKLQKCVFVTLLNYVLLKIFISDYCNLTSSNDFFLLRRQKAQTADVRKSRRYFYNIFFFISRKRQNYFENTLT